MTPEEKFSMAIANVYYATMAIDSWNYSKPGINIFGRPTMVSAVGDLTDEEKEIRNDHIQECIRYYEACQADEEENAWRPWHPKQQQGR